LEGRKGEKGKKKSGGTGTGEEHSPLGRTVKGKKSPMFAGLLAVKKDW